MEIAIIALFALNTILSIASKVINERRDREIKNKVMDIKNKISYLEAVINYFEDTKESKNGKS